MQWLHYFSGFWAGMFLTNAIPHLVQGISGNIPTPFAKPSGKGLSSPFINVLWALLNVVIGYWLLMSGKVSTADHLSMLTFFAGMAVISLFLAKRFVHKDKA
ncbi:hypothetical protein [Chitinophaga sp.]|uniref:hypothetical protein n=1 Tax=Chitinophaga sp. TaxID=1869181 RepID=UPI002F921BFD